MKPYEMADDPTVARPTLTAEVRDEFLRRGGVILGELDLDGAPMNNETAAAVSGRVKAMMAQAEQEGLLPKGLRLVFSVEMNRETGALHVTIDEEEVIAGAIMEHITNALGIIKRLPNVRETALVHTKLEEAALWLWAFRRR